VQRHSRRRIPSKTSATGGRVKWPPLPNIIVEEAN
jgi:hypothetical protein